MKLIIAALLLGTSFLIHAQTIEIQNPWVRATAPGQKNTALFMLIKNKSDQEISLIGATTELTPQVELHNHIKEGDVFKMRAVEKIAIPAKGEVTLKPGSLHVMLFNIPAQVTPGQEINFNLTFDNKETIKVKAPAKQM